MADLNNLKAGKFVSNDNKNAVDSNSSPAVGVIVSGEPKKVNEPTAVEVPEIDLLD